MKTPIWQWLGLAGLAYLLLVGAPSCADKVPQSDGAIETKSDGGTQVDAQADTAAPDTQTTPDETKADKGPPDSGTPDQVKDSLPDNPPADRQPPDQRVEPDTPTPDVTQGDTTTTPDLQAIKCGPRTQRYSGALCGTTAKPCKQLLEEVVADTPKSRSTLPGIALDARQVPHVIYNNNVSGFNGFFSTRSAPGQWQTTKMPRPAATATLTSDKSGQIAAFTYDGAFGNTIWLYNQGQWKSLYQWKGSFGAKRQSIDSDDAGCLHLTYKDKDKPTVQYARYGNGRWGDSAWSNFSLHQRALIRQSPGGQTHIAFWAYDTNTRKSGLFWSNSRQRPTAISALTPGSLNQAEIFLEVTKSTDHPAGQPHIVAWQQPTRGKTTPLVYLTQDAAGAWKQLVLEKSDNASCPIPQNTGETCAYSYTFHRPLAIVHGGDAASLRIIYASMLHKGKLTAKCTGNDKPGRIPPPPRMCTWEGTRSIASSVNVAWIENGAAKKTTIKTDTRFSSAADAQLDDKGNIHMTFLGYKPTTKNPGHPIVFYWKLGN